MAAAKTGLLYQEDTYKFVETAQIIECNHREDGRIVLILDQTIFHPQGGGQPSDIGTISAFDNVWTARVSACRLNLETGQVEHEVSFGSEIPSCLEGTKVLLAVDGEQRIFNARLHTAGHLLSHVIDELELPLESIKGYHFPAGPYVEYEPVGEMDLSPAGITKLQRDIERGSNELIQRAQEVWVTNAAPGSIGSEGLSKKAQKADVVRFIGIEGTRRARPCGGTHLANTREIGKLMVKKITLKKGILRICYLVSDI